MTSMCDTCLNHVVDDAQKHVNMCTIWCYHIHDRVGRINGPKWFTNQWNQPWYKWGNIMVKVTGHLLWRFRQYSIILHYLLMQYHSEINCLHIWVQCLAKMLWVKGLGCLWRKFWFSHGEHVHKNGDSMLCKVGVWGALQFLSHLHYPQVPSRTHEVQSIWLES